MQAIPTSSQAEWMAILQRCVQYDVYHLPSYHRLAEQRGEGEAYLLVFTENDYCIALPLLLRPIEQIPGLDGVGKGWRDATSVYGYVGPVASHRCLPAPVVARFQAALSAFLRKHQVITLFARCHTLIEQQAILNGLGEQLTLGPTVSIQPCTDDQKLIHQYRSTHRAHIYRLRRAGATLSWELTQDNLQAFIRLYHETMKYVGASEWYYFDADYFRHLFEQVAGAIYLLSIELEHERIGAAIFTSCAGIVQYHLGATSSAHRKLSPMKLLIHEAALWAAQQGASVLHLGGGVGAQEDDLFHFKAGFSDLRHTFRVWRWVLHPTMYQNLVQTQTSMLAVKGMRRTNEQFYPLYRSPVAQG